VECQLKTTLVKIAAAAAGITLAFCIAGGSVLWHLSRPKPLKPWNEQALVVMDAPDFDLYAERDPTIALYYSIHNTTISDYSIETPRFKIVAVLANGTLSDPLGEERVIVRTPIFIPASRIGMVVLHLKGIHAPERNQSESEKEYRERLRQVMNDRLSNIHGFIRFDDVNRYQINLPGWATTKPERSGESKTDQQNPQ
jgi:hypothetical protein